jgi:thioredoxin reductase (NADPH)
VSTCWPDPHLHGEARSAILISWGDWANRDTADAILQAMAAGHANYYVLKPWSSPDELFHRTVAEYLHDWARNEVESRRRWWSSATGARLAVTRCAIC